MEERYAQSGLEDLACSHEAPSADTLLYRLKKLRSEDAYQMLVRVNDEIIGHIRKRGVFRKPVIAAIDLTDDPYYGDYNEHLRRSRKDRGTNLFYTYASLHVVEHGRRVTIFETPVHQLDDHAMIVERLINAAKEERGIRIRILLIDRGFYSVDVMRKLDEMGVRYLMPAIKNERIKRAIEEHHNGLIPNMVKFSIRNAAEQQAFFGLMIYPRKGARDTDPVHEKYIVFATNMRYREAFRLSPQIPDEYRRRWGIETGYRVQNQVKAKTTSTNYTVRLVYQMLSVILYNAWQLVNILLAIELGTELRKPLVKLTQLVRVIRTQIEYPDKSG